jgi:hypothetical protein
MTWFLKKSLSLGRLFRLNFSKSGVGVSFGVKGARVGVGPNGKYANFGRGGLYFRQSLGSTGRQASPEDTMSAESQERVRRLVSERPLGWEYLLLADALDQGLEVTRQAYAGETVLDQESMSSQAALSEVDELLDVLNSCCARLTEVMNTDLQVALGPQGCPGDPDAIIQAAFSITEQYTYLHNAKFRACSIPAKAYFEPIKTELGKSVDGVCAELDGLPEQIRSGVWEAVQSAKSGEGKGVGLTVVFKIVNEDGLIAASKMATDGVRQEFGT